MMKLDGEHAVSLGTIWAILSVVYGALFDDMGHAIISAFLGGFVILLICTVCDGFRESGLKGALEGVVFFVLTLITMAIVIF